MQGPACDVGALRRYLGPGGVWARRCGARVRGRREMLDLEVRQLARLADTSSGTVSRVELGRLVPREWLRAAIAHALGAEVADLWPPPRRLELAASTGMLAEIDRTAPHGLRTRPDASDVAARGAQR